MKYCCRTLETAVEKYSGTLEENSSILNMASGDLRKQHIVLRLYGLTRNGNISTANKNSSWSSLHYCPFCGTHLTNSVVIGQHKISKMFVVEINGKHDPVHTFGTKEEAVNFSRTIPLVIEG